MIHNAKEEEIITCYQRYYIKATSTLYDLESEATISNTSFAREEENKKGMDASQITGTASSYARKYALNGLFNIDDTKDADTDEYTKTTSKKEENTTPKKDVDGWNKLAEDWNKVMQEDSTTKEIILQPVKTAIKNKIISEKDMLDYFKIKSIDEMKYEQVEIAKEIITKRENKIKKSKEEVF
jgi:hypothetical protein